MFIKTSADPGPDYGLLSFGGPVNFRGYFPGYSYNATEFHNWWSWAILKSHPRNTAGSVTLKSADPLDTPNILFNYFDTGNGDYDKDLQQITEAIRTSRNALNNQPTKFNEILPGGNVQTTAQIKEYVKNTAWGHHCSSTCPIGVDSDPYAVLDSSFRVRKVQGLRVVDASVYPRIPGTFTAASTYLVGEKAADVILSQLNSTASR
jgi:choline dehydrogenase